MWSPQYSAWRLLDEAWPKALIAVFRRRAKSIQVSDRRLSPRQRPPFVAIEAHELCNELGRLRGAFNFGASRLSMSASFAVWMRLKSTVASATRRAASRRAASASSPTIRVVSCLSASSYSGSAATGTARPCRRAFLATRAMPSLVRGPVLRRAFRRLASARAGVMRLPCVRHHRCGSKAHQGNDHPEPPFAPQ